MGSPVRSKLNQSNSSQSTFGQLNLTIAKFYRISGNSTQHKGVIPDIEFPSLIPLDKYGEDNEPSALPFDIIDKTDYLKTAELSSVLPQLIKLHNDRMTASNSYKYLLEDIAELKEHDNEDSVTLNETALKKQRDADDEKLFERINLRRVAMGLPALKKGEKQTGNDDLDFLKLEAGQIMTDYIGRN